MEAKVLFIISFLLFIFSLPLFIATPVAGAWCCLIFGGIATATGIETYQNNK